MFKVFTEIEAFTKIVIDEKSPNWRSILSNHAEVHINISRDELSIAELDETSPIFQFIKENNGRVVIASPGVFEEVYKTPEVALQYPRSAFFLKLEKEEAEELQNSLGVIIQPTSDINDSLLKGSYFKDLQKNATFGVENGKGWHGLVQCELPPSNAMVISDEHLFSNEEADLNVGQANIIPMIDAFLPKYLKTDFHILILTNDAPRGSRTPRAEAWCLNLANELKDSIAALRPYPIIVEVVFASALHKRRLIMNYLNVWCDKGFAVFRATDVRTVRDENDFNCNRAFNRTKADEGDTDFYSVSLALDGIKQKCISVQEFIRNRGQAVPGYRVLADCIVDKGIQNRLIQYI